MATRGGMGRFRALSFDEQSGADPAPAPAKPGRKAIIGRPLTPAERQERRRLMRAVQLAEHFDQAEAAISLVRHEINRSTPELDLALATLEERLQALREYVNV